MIGKQEFVETVKGIQDTCKEEVKIDGMFESIRCFEYFSCDFSALPCFKALETILKINFNKDQLDLIWWWLYDDVEKVLFDEETKEVVRRLDTIEDLYDYLKDEF